MECACLEQNFSVLWKKRCDDDDDDVDKVKDELYKYITETLKYILWALTAF